MIHTRQTLASLVVSLLVFSLHAGAGITPVDPRCEGAVQSIAASPAPRFSWRIESEERGSSQSAWQILVASSPDLLDKDQADLWDSGKVAAARSPLVNYAGKPLKAGQVGHWKVRCWDANDKASPWTSIAAFETAPATPADWSGALWIDDGKANPERDEDFYKPDPAPLLRREFTLGKPVLRARLHVAGLGLCLPSLNGKRLEDHIFDPPWTAFEKRILFRTHDVTTQLTEGANCIGLALGNGWFNPLPMRMWGNLNLRNHLVTGRPRVIACLVVDHPDGTQTKVTTGPGWATTEGPTVRNSIFIGEDRDARLSIPGWDVAGFDATKWKSARVTDASLAPLQALEMLPIRPGKTLPATAITTPQPGIHIVDFGTNFTGIPEIDLRVPAGTTLTFRYGELLRPDGNLNPLTSVCGQIKGSRKQPDGSMRSVGGPGAPEIAWQQDSYIANGSPNECFRPDFTYHAFRFMEIVGLSEAPQLTDCRAIPFNTELPSMGEFSSSNERLNRIQQITRRTFLSNAVGVQSDCPHRERFGYGGDIVATSEAFIMNFDMAGFYAKTVRDWGDAALPSGLFPDTAPYVGIKYCGVGWGMAHPHLLEQLYQYYGNRTLIEEQLPIAIRWIESEAARRKDGLVTVGLGDHEGLAKARGPALGTPMFIDAARRIARLARLIDQEKQAARCEALAFESETAWAAAFMNSETGMVGIGSQSEQSFALGFGVVPEASRPAVFDYLVKDLNKPEDRPRLSTGIYGTRHLLEQLPLLGRNDLAYALANRNTFPSWGWMLEKDATTLWEHWAGSDNTFSNNHPMFGSISAWFFRWLGGIQLAPDAVGFDRIVIRPQPVPDLKWVKCSHRSVRGMIESNWAVNAEGTEFDIVIPAGTTAIVELPASAGDRLTESGDPIKAAKGIKVLPAAPALHRLQVGGGRYQFIIRR